MLPYTGQWCVHQSNTISVKLQKWGAGVGADMRRWQPKSHTFAGLCNRIFALWHLSNMINWLETWDAHGIIGLGFPFCQATTSNKKQWKKTNSRNKAPKRKKNDRNDCPSMDSYFAIQRLKNIKKHSKVKNIIRMIIPNHGFPLYHNECCWNYKGGETQTSSNHESFPCIWKPVVWIWTRLPVIFTQTKVQSTPEDQRYKRSLWFLLLWRHYQSRWSLSALAQGSTRYIY